MAKPKLSSVEAVIFYVFQYSNVFGVLNHSYDREQHKLVCSRKMVTYSIAMHSALIIYLPISVLSGFGFPTGDIYATSPIAAILDIVVTILNSLCVCISLISQWTCRSRMLRLFNDLNGIWFNEMTNWEKSQKIQRDTCRLLCIAAFSTVIMIIATLYMTYEYHLKSIMMAISVVYFTLLLNIAITGQFQFVMGMLYSGYMFKVLNYRLARTVEDIQMESISRRMARLLSKELTKIGRIHGELLRLTIGIKNLYQYLVLTILLTCFVAVVELLFYLSVIFRSLNMGVTGFKVLQSIGVTIFSIGDLWIQLYICGVVVDACNASGAILRVLSEKQNVNTELEKSIEMLSLQLVREKMQLTICGMFNLDGNTNFAMTKAAMMHLILLLQIDYEYF